MNIMLVAQCSKRALVETRRILDQFAERRGDRTWQTAITLEGLNTLRRLLRKTARRNTAVACHWIKSANQTELLWIVGNQRCFNRQGAVPTNVTQRDILRRQDEDQWRSAECVSLLAAIAGLFHDFGKANALFQQGLRGQAKGYQPYRHEWVSLRLFCAWVGGRDDREWLAALANISEHDEKTMLNSLKKDSVGEFVNPFISLSPQATVVAWLIVSHHRLPVYPKDKKRAVNPPKLDETANWLTQQLVAEWNSTNNWVTGWTAEERRATWHFPYGTPMRSAIWRGKARKFALRALQQPALNQFGMLEQRFTSHMARLVLMLADHYYSSQAPTLGWQDADYHAYANTDGNIGMPKQLKQQLDEHCVGVGQNALLLGRSLSRIRTTLPAITQHKKFKQRSEKEKFRWQDRAYDLACSMRERSVRQGFFGVNMASTGRGKTFANARIMYGLADEAVGCRFSVAMGLRTLTLQTGDALKTILTLEDDDLAVLIGSAAIQQLYQLDNDVHESPGNGSASAEALFSEHHYVSYDGSLDDGRLSRWLKSRDGSKPHKLLSAPVLVTTIDHLIGATEGIRGGKQIAPMLRLLTADLVLDEPDDFDIADLPALCRLVNWAGMLGSRVLLSSATLPPALVQALFNAYKTGRADYQQVCGLPETPLNVCCAWFDENLAVQQDVIDGKSFKAVHEAFVVQRIEKLQYEPPLRRGLLVDVQVQPAKSVLDSVAETIFVSMHQLHSAHRQTHLTGKTVSLGLVRMANIGPLVAVARRLIRMAAPENTRIHYCVYHSQHPLAMRSHIERRLDETLKRGTEKALWQIAEISHALQSYPEQHHLFVVLASPVAEVGRDHDYDWAIAEPSSMRSLIQLAGRIQRHREMHCKLPNLYVLQKNVKALKNTPLAYCHPGFESQRFGLQLVSHDLHEILPSFQNQIITASLRIIESIQPRPRDNLVDLEHACLRTVLQGRADLKNEYFAARWWREQETWCGEAQRRSPFRQSYEEEQHYLWMEDETDKPSFKFPDSVSDGWKSSDFCHVEVDFANGVQAWVGMDYVAVYQQLAERLNMELKDVSQQFGEITLREKTEERWHFHPLLGVFGALE
ncbi:type I-F CRISPR-associated helicase Cas3f [Serratia rubidaea]|uniref:type I-F CRISPR-associated helicase Cas3f n=1 Tax=Serratia rubidaea TaxID=61652 RepID=UPI0023B194DF|nr:type I-F CRISPR-associated helicase Cas3f [Serratia rubidaea]MDK1706315.1 type I-F CRISPR-associated helicase Cas3f [Serratia rubidaea]